MLCCTPLEDFGTFIGISEMLSVNVSYIQCSGMGIIQYPPTHKRSFVQPKRSSLCVVINVPCETNMLHTGKDSGNLACAN